MAKNQSDILFGVEGGDSLSGASGKKIAQQLNGIVNKLNKKIKFVASLDTSKTQSEFIKQLNRIQHSVKFQMPEIDAKSIDNFLNGFSKINKKIQSDFSKTSKNIKNSLSFNNKNSSLNSNLLSGFKNNTASFLKEISGSEKSNTYTTKKQISISKYSGSEIGNLFSTNIQNSSTADINKNGPQTFENYNTKINSGTNALKKYAAQLQNSKGQMQSLTAGLVKSSVSMETLKTTSVQTSKAMSLLGSLKSFAISGAIDLAVQGLVAGITWILDSIPTTEKLGEKLSQINTELSDLKSENENLNSELQTTKEKIEELNSKGNLSVFDKSELENLKEVEKQTEAQIALNKALQKNKTKEQGKAFTDWMKSRDSDIYRSHVIMPDYYNSMASYGIHKDNNLIRNTRSSDLNSYIINSYDELNFLKNSYKQAVSDNNEKDAKKIKSQIDSLEKELQEKYDDIAENASDVEYIKEPSTEEEKNINKYLDIINVFKANIVANSGDIKGAFEQIASIPRFSDLVAQLTELGDAGQLTGDNLLSLWNSSEEFKDFINLLNQSNLIDWKNILGNNFKDLDTTNDGLASYDEIIAYATNHSEEFKNALSGIGNKFNEINKESKETTDNTSEFIKQTKSLAENFEDINNKKSSISDMLTELNNDGGLSSKSLLSLLDNFSEVDGFENYIKILTSGKSSVKEMQNALNGLYIAYINSKDILNDVNEENFDYIEMQLKALGITNAHDVAINGLAYSLTNAALSKGNLNSETINSIKTQLLEKGANQEVANTYVNVANICMQAQSAMSGILSEQTKKRLNLMGTELSGIKTYAQAQEQLRTAAIQNGNTLRWNQWKNKYGEEQAMRKILGDKAVDEALAYGKQAEALTASQNKLKSLTGQISGGSSYKTNLSAVKSNSSSFESPEEKHKKAFDEWYENLKWRRENNIISEAQYLKSLDSKYRSHFSNKSKYLDEYAKYSQEVYSGFKKLYQDDLNNQKEALEKQKEELKELADARKQALDDAKSEEDYKKDQTEKREEINKLKTLIASFRGTLSLSSQKKLRELQKELSEKEEELNEFEKDKALERAKEQIDKEYEQQEKKIDAKIENIDKILDNISKDIPAIRSAVVGFAKKHGVPITKAYAGGTFSVSAVTQENGAEIIAGNIRSGQFTMLTPTSKVWNASATNALWDFANSPEAYINSIMNKIDLFKQKAASMIYSQPVSVNMGGITINGSTNKNTLQKIKESQKEQVSEILKCFKKMQ